MRLTQVILEINISGPQIALESLQSYFTLFKKFFGPIFKLNESASTNKMPLNGEKNLKLKLFSKLPNTLSSSKLCSKFRMRTFYTHIGLWLTASSIYRELCCFEEANLAIDEIVKEVCKFIITESFKNLLK